MSLQPIDVDPTMLRATAEASAHAYARSIWHIDEEIAAASGDLEPLYATLTEEGPYAYMVMPELRPDGTVKLPRITTREEIVEAYEMIRGMSDLLEVIGLTEIRGTWYTFQDNISRACMKGDASNVHTVQTLGMFPSGSGPGITGELVWIRYRIEALGGLDEPNTIPDDPLVARARVYHNFSAYQQGLRDNDVGAVMAVLHGHLFDRARLCRGYRHDHCPSGRRGTPRVLRGILRQVRGAVGRHDQPGHRGLVRLRRAPDRCASTGGLRHTGVPYRGILDPGQDREVHRPYRARYRARTPITASRSAYDGHDLSTGT